MPNDFIIIVFETYGRTILKRPIILHLNIKFHKWKHRQHSHKHIYKNDTTKYHRWSHNRRIHKLSRRCISNRNKSEIELRLETITLTNPTKNNKSIVFGNNHSNSLSTIYSKKAKKQHIFRQHMQGH